MRGAIAAAAAAALVAAQPQPDWLVTRVTTPATVTPGPNGTLTFGNGLISRTFSTSPFATVDYWSHQTSSSLLRGIQPEAIVQLDDVTYFIGDGYQDPNAAGYGAYLNRTGFALLSNASAWRYSGYHVTVRAGGGGGWSQRPTLPARRRQAAASQSMFIARNTVLPLDLAPADIRAFADRRHS
jgi:hypothetical protein